MNLKIQTRKCKIFIKRYFTWYRKDYLMFLSLSKELCSDFKIIDKLPFLNDKNSFSGEIGGHYFSQDIYVAREIYNAKPDKHVDIGSRVDGFISHIAVFREIEVFDIRPLDINSKNIIFKQVDLMDMNSCIDNYTDSISCLHTIEHFGLGRYGDIIDPLGHIKGFENISRILKPNGIFYFSVPMGFNRVEFNEQRIFSLEYLLKLIDPVFEVQKFTYVDDSGLLHESVELTENNILTNCGCYYGCAIFNLKKIKINNK